MERPRLKAGDSRSGLTALRSSASGGLRLEAKMVELKFSLASSGALIKWSKVTLRNATLVPLIVGRSSGDVFGMALRP
jgi:soluble P-type ATPase